MKLIRGKRKRFFAMVLMIVLVFTSIQTTPVKADTANADQQNQTIFTGEGFDVLFQVTSQWDGAFNADVTIENTSDKVIDNWAVEFQMPYEITNIWNGIVESCENGKYVIKNAGSNQDIGIGQSVNFGFSANGVGTLVLPDKYSLLSNEEKLSEKGFEIGFRVISDWTSGFNGEISIKNISEITIEDWKLEFDYDGKIESFWTAEVLEHKDNHYVIKNAGYNANIQPGETVALGFSGTRGELSSEPLNYKLNQITSKVDYDKDTDGDSLPDYYEKQIGTNPFVRDTDGDNIEDGIELTYNMNPLAIDSDNNGITDDQEDFDQDGLKCIEEIKLGTDNFNKDTDRDKLIDGEEVNKYFTNPLVYDSDEDGLGDGTEVERGLNPLSKDSNSDGILDVNEKFTQNIVQTIDSEERSQIKKVSVSFEGTGDIEQTTTIEDTYGKDLLSSGVVGLIGVPVNIKSNSIFERATITFTYDETQLGETKEDDLRVMWYDEENNQYVIQDEETVVDKIQNTISYTTTHFSTYLVVDRQKWYDVWSNALSYRRKPPISSIPTEYFDICYVIDKSGSMYGTNISNAKLAIENFISAMYSNDRGAIIGFDYYSSTYSTFTNDKNILKNKLQTVSADGGTNVEAGLKAALDLFDNTPDQVINSMTNTKMILLLCDGDVYYTEETLKRAKDKGIKIYPVLIGSTYGQTALQKIADTTGGKFYYAATADEIRKSIFGVQGDTIGEIDTTDSDGDGLYDIYETAGMIIPNGQYIYSDPTTKFTDGDSLTDGQEMGVLERFEDQSFIKQFVLKLQGFDNTIYAQYFNYTSNPNEIDSDFDTYADDNDKEPLKSNLVECRLTTNYFGSYALEEDYVPVDYYGDKSYGGNQGWFEKEFDGIHAKNLTEAGCGLIAGTDLFIYLLMNNNKKNYTDELFNGTAMIESDRYIALACMAELKYLNVLELYNKTSGVLGYTLSNGMNQIFTALDLPYKADWRISGGNGDVLSYIYYMIEHNIPAVISIGPWGNTDGVNFYTRTSKVSGGYQYKLRSDAVTGHYVSVTGITVDSVDNSIYLQISSWGKKLYINYQDYIAYRGKNTTKSITTAVLLVKENN